MELKLAKKVPNSVQVIERAEASIGEKKILEALLAWATPYRDTFLEAISADKNLPISDLIMFIQLDATKLDVALLNQAQRAAECRLALAIEPEQRPEGEEGEREFKVIVRDKDNTHEITAWDGSVKAIAIPYPEAIAADIAANRSSPGYEMVKRLNEWCANNFDQHSGGFKSLFGGSPKTPVFSAAVNTNFAKYYWSQDEISTGFRITSDFQLGFSATGVSCIGLSATNSLLDPFLTPNLDKRQLPDLDKCVLVEILVPLVPALSSPDGVEIAVASIFKQCNRGSLPSSLGEEVRGFGMSADFAKGGVVGNQQLSGKTITPPGGENKENKLSALDLAKLRRDNALAVKAISQAVTANPDTIALDARMAVRGALNALATAAGQGKQPDDSVYDILVMKLPAQFHEQVSKVRSAIK